MRGANRQLKLIADDAAVSTNLTDTSGNPSESYYWSHLAAVRREWLHEFWSPQADSFEIPLAEITKIELRVRRELYP